MTDKESTQSAAADVQTILTGLPFWNGLTENEKSVAMQGTIMRTYEKGMEIHGGTDACLGLVAVQKGSIRVYMTSPEGREVTLFHLPAGEYCVFSAACVISEIDLDVQMSAEETVQLTAVHAGTVAKLMDSNLSFRCSVYELATHRYAEVVWVMQQILFDHFDVRMARLLLSTAQQTGSRTIRMTQEEMAKEVNSAREVVARMLRQFAEEGWIELKRGRVILKDEEALKNLVE